MADLKLADDTFKKILKHHGENLSPAEIPKEQRTVLLVYHAHGIIGNGGFQYLFEHNFPGDQGFVLTRKAHEAIGARSACDAFDKAFAVFPDATPPADIALRLEIWSEHYALIDAFYDDESPDAIYLSALDETMRLLAQYIRGNRAAFKSLK